MIRVSDDDIDRLGIKSIVVDDWGNVRMVKGVAKNGLVKYDSFFFDDDTYSSLFWASLDLEYMGG
jgi:hypothetical protein